MEITGKKDETRINKFEIDARWLRCSLTSRDWMGCNCDRSEKRWCQEEKRMRGVRSGRCVLGAGGDVC